ncbi:MAG: hypothetical protein JO097_17385 [Acidobacteriaceae bacterium]|nr:hypothetical protein [Acidobacteriaceae bacterium]MBV9767849.1 hypothetical protein [Acidobacteriaceae bacterium]
MTAVKLAALISFGAAAYSFQQPLTPPQATGLETPWDVVQTVSDLQHNTEQLQPLLSTMNPQRWYDQKGAPTTYILQWQTAQQQLKDVMVTAKLLAQKPSSLSLSLDVYFRLEALDVTTRSLDEGAQKYADRATADKLGALIAHNFNSRERFRDYLRDLAQNSEQNFKIADEEAQRCRGIISKEPAPNSTRRSKRQ